MASAGAPQSAFAQLGAFGGLPDVRPGDWAYTAVSNLARKYNCLPGSNNRLGGRSVTRYEFAVNLSACLDVVDDKARRPGAVGSADLQTVQRLRWQFAAELAGLRARAGAPYSDAPRLPTAISRIDFGGGERMGYLLYKLDPELVGGGYHTGLLTSRLTPIRFDDGRGRISFYGQFNNAFVNVDNGNGDHSFFGTNGASQNFLGARLSYSLSPDFRIGARLAFSAAFNRSDFKSDFDDNDEAGCDKRHPGRTFCAYDANVFLSSRTYGRLTLGWGETASSGIGGITLGGTAYVTNNDPAVKAGWHEVVGLGTRFGDIAPDVTGVTRGALVRYDSPSLAGFAVSASFGDANHTGAPADAGDFWDVALRYAGEFSGFRIAAGVGYQDYNREGHGLSQNNLTFGGSIMHVPTGLFFSGSVSSIGRDAPFNPGSGETDRASAWYFQGGISQNWFGLGHTVLYGEYGETNNGANAGAYFYRDSETTNWGAGVVQNIDAAAMSLYLTYNNIEPTLNNVEGKEIQVVTFGTRIKF